MRFRQNWGVIKIFKYLCELKDFQKCWLYCVWYLFKLKTWKSLACVPLYPRIFLGTGNTTIEKGKSLLSMDGNGARPSANFLYIGEFFLQYRKSTLNGTFPLRHLYRGPTEHTTYICTCIQQEHRQQCFTTCSRETWQATAWFSFWKKKIGQLFVEFSVTFSDAIANSLIRYLMPSPYGAWGTIPGAIDSSWPHFNSGRSRPGN
jgi:hypothetical protein